MILLAIILIIVGALAIYHEPGSGVGLICVIVALIMLLASCGDDDATPVEIVPAPAASSYNEGLIRGQIRACIDDVGHPYFTTYADGSLREFLGCGAVR